MQVLFIDPEKNALSQTRFLGVLIDVGEQRLPDLSFADVEFPRVEYWDLCPNDNAGMDMSCLDTP
jgi:hypothetical protein